MMRLGARGSVRFEVRGFVPGRGFTVRIYDAPDKEQAVRAFKRDFPKAQAFWTALAPEAAAELGCACQVEGPELGLHTAEERRSALEMARQAWEEGLTWISRSKLKFATEKLGFLQGISAIANQEGHHDLVKEVDQMLLDLGERLSNAWKLA